MRAVTRPASGTAAPSERTRATRSERGAAEAVTIRPSAGGRLRFTGPRRRVYAALKPRLRTPDIPQREGLHVGHRRRVRLWARPALLRRLDLGPRTVRAGHRRGQRRAP